MFNNFMYAIYKLREDFSAIGNEVEKITFSTPFSQNKKENIFDELPYSKNEAINSNYKYGEFTAIGNIDIIDDEKYVKLSNEVLKTLNMPNLKSSNSCFDLTVNVNKAKAQDNLMPFYLIIKYIISDKVLKPDYWYSQTADFVFNIPVIILDLTVRQDYWIVIKINRDYSETVFFNNDANRFLEKINNNGYEYIKLLKKPPYVTIYTTDGLNYSYNVGDYLLAKEKLFYKSKIAYIHVPENMTVNIIYTRDTIIENNKPAQDDEYISSLSVAKKL